MTDTSQERRLRIDLWADVVCPVCYLGDNRLQRAIAESGHADRIDLVLHSFELHPDTPDEILDNSEVLAKMTGASVDEVEAGEEQFGAVARADGLPFSIRRGHRNTKRIHRMIKLAGRYDASVALMDLVQRAAFGGNYDAFGDEFLIDAAVSVGVPEPEAREVASTEQFADDVDADRNTALRLGARGVPFAVFDDRFAVPGAASVDGYRQAIEKALAAEVPASV
ncbi:DsbA family oxidoreductase [Leucobacter celer]|uniref:DsbA family oxidoreductase n=1 Tax=Leucobacter celer TaxID=668625 RepID=UPI0006A766AA|nr:DsbA family oxidoreductase [Leucobacter celer]